MNRLHNALDALTKQHVICLPTDTVFGMATRFSDDIGKAEIFRRKNRPLDQALPIVCCDIAMMKKYVLVSERDQRIISHFSPGALTYILPAISNASPPTFAVRIPDDDFVLEVIRNCGEALWMTSANPHRLPTAPTDKEISTFFPDIYVVDGTSGEVASTIIDLQTLDIIREGVIKKEAIMAFIKEEKL